MRPLSFTLLTILAVAVAAAIAAFMIGGAYTQHTTLAGRLVPDLGVLKVFAPQQGTIVENHAFEGRAVERGDVLFVVSSERLSSTLAQTHARVAAELDRRRRSLEAQASRTHRLEAAERASIDRMLAALDGETSRIETMLSVQRERLELAETAASRYAQLSERGFISAEALAARREHVIEQRARIESLGRERARGERELAELTARRERLPLEFANRLAELERAIATLSQQRTENEVRRRVAVTAPAAGIVTAIVGELGQAATSARPLASIVPAGATLYAELYAPSRAIGFVEAGDTALLRYAAYPYQKFGHQRATIKAVARIAAPVAELAGSAPGNGAAAAEPIYRVRAALPAQTFAVYGRPHRLQAGMAVEADVALETRRLYEWMLEPLFTLTRGPAAPGEPAATP